MTLMAEQETRECTRCHRRKPLEEFYPRGRGRGVNDRKTHCRDCDNSRRRTRTETRVIRVRARHRATADLIRAHRGQFDALIEAHTEACEAEAELIREHERSSHQSGIPRISPGPRRPGQSAVDRISERYGEGSLCPHCSTLHEHGHTCVVCGADPEAGE